MKKISGLFVLIFIALGCAAQLPPVNDTLIPKQHKRDTAQYEPKLQGGALIDTINTKDKSYKYQPAHIDSLQKSLPPKKGSGKSGK